MTTVSRRAALTPRQLTRTGERLSFIYLERCTVHRDANAITAEDAEGTTRIPSATIGTLLLDPGTRITHQAMSVLGETGAAVCWVGEQGVRYYAGGRALTRSSALAEAQAVQWANVRSRLGVARAMYRLRFPDEDPAGLTRHELLGHEGRRVKDCYRAQSTRTGVPWRGRRYTPLTSAAVTRSTKPLPQPPSACTASPTQSSPLWAAARLWASFTPATSSHSSLMSPTCTRPRSESRSRSTLPPRTRRTSAPAHAARFGIASDESFGGWTKTFTDPRLCAAIVDRLTFNGTIIETGTDSYRLASTRARAEHAEAG